MTSLEIIDNTLCSRTIRIIVCGMSSSFVSTLHLHNSGDGGGLSPKASQPPFSSSQEPAVTPLDFSGQITSPIHSLSQGLLPKEAGKPQAAVGIDGMGELKYQYFKDQKDLGSDASFLICSSIASRRIRSTHYSNR